MENEKFQPVVDLLEKLRRKVPPSHYNRKNGSSIQIIDMGHGGLVNGHYVTAPSKMCRHSEDFTFYEGVFDRALGYTIAYELLVANRNYIFVDTSDHDMTLMDRRRRIDRILPALTDMGYKPWLHSVHGNAAEVHQATGFELYTLPGYDDSDKIAELIFEEAKRLKWEMRRGSDGVDKEARFSILKNDCPSILTEWGFFTNYEQALQMCNPETISSIAVRMLHADIEIEKKEIL